MTAAEPVPCRFAASAVIAFPRLAMFLEPILDSIASHDMQVSPDTGGFAVQSPFGTARLVPGEGELWLSVEAAKRSGLNRMKHALSGPIDFIARSEALDITWQGDRTGPLPPDDLRVLEVAAVNEVTPRLRRITFTGCDLARYATPAQIHGRLLFQPKGAAVPQWPMLDDDGRIVWPASGRLASRVYTIRRIDAAAGELDIDFALHDAGGPATAWACAAVPGDIVGILGPAAHGPRPAGWYVLAGDETALPGIARILASLPAEARGIALVEVDSPDDEQDLAAPAGMDLRWLHRAGAAPGSTTLLLDALRACPWPADRSDIFFWGGCEFHAFRLIHRFLRAEIGLPSDRQVFYSHWHRGLSEEAIVAAGAEAYLP